MAKNKLSLKDKHICFSAIRHLILIAEFFYVYDGEGNIVRSIDISGKKEYNYEYEEGRIVRATEANITLSGEIVTSKVIVNTVKYYYDSEGKMTKKVITFADNSTHTVHYENSDNNTVVKFDVPDTENKNKKQTITSHSKTDSFGRKVFYELQLGRGFVSRQFSYMPGAITDAHKENKKIKSTATTQLVSHITLSDGRTLSYEYDKEEKITKVIDSVDGTTEYTYDALGQLLTEKVNDRIVNTMTYDNYGNIISKNGKQYCYDETWHDLLTCYNGQAIEYDAQGNPTSYLGHTLTWEKGRQLKSFDRNTYTYNANGIRTSKTVNGVKHTYTLDGTKILRETWGNNTLIPLYDNEDSVCGILYNSVPYYFLKNLQGDVIAIVDKDAETVARYSYDAWGVPTIKQDTSGCQIATINPFRYRSYYYDKELGLYYLQSRYYDASISRFLNADDIETLRRVALSTDTNLFLYCGNNPVNSTDASGNLVEQLIARIIIGLILGFLVQLLCDWILYLCNKYISKKNAKISMHPADYVSSMITWALICVVPNSRLLTFFTIATPIAVKHVWRLCTGKFDIKNFLYDLAVGAIAFAISCCIDRHTAQKCGQIVKKFRGDKNAASKIAASTTNFKAKMSVLGIKINLTIAIAAPLLQLIYSALVMCFS